MIVKRTRTRGYDTSSHRSPRDLNSYLPHVNQSAVRYNKQDAYDCNNRENTAVVSELIGSQNGGVIVIKGSIGAAEKLADIDRIGPLEVSEKTLMACQESTVHTHI